MKLIDALFHPKHSSAEEYEHAATILETFVAGTCDVWEWDDFTSIKKRDSYLESVRTRCIAVRDEYPALHAGAYCDEEGYTVLSALAKEVREKAHALAHA